MRTINNQRPKAFIGAAISVGTQLIGGIIGRAKKRKAEEAARLEQERQAKLQAAQQQASYMTENAENDANVYKNIRNQLMRNGGNISRKGVAPLIVEGGTAIPIKKDSFLLKGRKHNTGGIIIGKGKNSIEAEGDEVVQITPKQLKVFSAQPILNGNSPADLVRKGANKNRVFNAQESFKDRNGLNDDGTKKAKLGKKEDVPTDATTVQKPIIPQTIERKVAPYDRVNAPVGTRYSDLSPQDKIHMKNSDRMREDYKGIEIVSPEFDILTGIRSLATLPKGFLKGSGKIKIEPNKYYRQVSRVDKGIERAKEIGVIDTKNPTIKKVINPKTGRPKIQLTRKEKFDVPFFSRDNLWYGRNKKYDVIVGNEKDFDWMPLTKHGNLRPDVQSDLSTHIRATPLVDGKTNVADASKFKYYRNYPVIGMRNVTEGFPTIPVTGLNALSNIIKAKKSSKRNNDMDRRIAYPKRALGGLSRKEDYGSKSKPYPNVKSSDFAGGHRSYPIPTKADARDALRLAGLHGRSDVKAKVYKKYPELKNKKATLGTFGSLTGANRRLLALNQNVPSAGITAGAKIINPSASSIKPINSGSKGFNLFKGIDKGEAISSGIGAAGTLISGLLNKGSIDKTSAPQVPTPQLIAPAKLKTSVNINPQLSDVRESELSQNRLVEGNTASSVASVARQQRISNNALSQRSRLRGEKENLETRLQNQDAINRQQVASSNAQQINEVNRFNSLSTIQTANDKIQATANNRTQMIEGITSAVRDYQLGVDKKRSEENAIAAMMSANPEQMELFLKLMEKNKSRLGNVRSTLFRCGGKKKIA